MDAQFHRSTQVANRLLELASEDNNTLTPMQVIKLVYLCHGWMLGVKHRPLIRESVEAWRYGPVIPELYHAVKSYRDMPITVALAVGGNPADFDDDENFIIETVYKIYGRFSGPYLSTLTHQPDTPWHHIWHGDGDLRIPNDLIEAYYEGLVRRQQVKEGQGRAA